MKIPHPQMLQAVSGRSRIAWFLNHFFLWTYILLQLNIYCFSEPLELYKSRCLTGLLCDQGRCLERSAICDGNHDCIDQSDEQHCDPCKVDEIRCSNRMCIPLSALCNRVVDCPGGEDEQPSFCLAHKCPNSFLCQITLDQCVTDPCSRVSRCLDYTDQAPEVCSVVTKPRTNVTCRPEEFTCRTGGQCINDLYRCDGFPDCFDGSDETEGAGCPGKTDSSVVDTNEFVCPGGLTIPRVWVCDQKADCPGAEDEAVGPNSLSRCPTKPDASPLKNICPPGTFACGQTSTLAAARCIPEERVCDGVYDCADLSDERANCEDPCAEHHQFTCRMGRGYRGQTRCVSFDALCNGHPDCPHGDDELEGPRTNCTSSASCEQNNGGCSQLCSLVGGRVKCECTLGYLSLPDAPKSCIAQGDKAVLYAVNGELYQHFLGKNITRVLRLGSARSASNSSVMIPTVQWHLETDTTDGMRQKFEGTQAGSWSSLSDFDYTFQRTDTSGLSEPLRLVFAYGWGIFSTATGDETTNTKSNTISGQAARRKRHQQQQLHPLAIHPNLPPDGFDQSHGVTTPLNVAYDWVHDLIYWTNSSSSTIHVTHRTSGWSKSLLQLAEHSQPLGIVVDPRFARIYWITRGRHSAIEVMDMDGQNRKSLVVDQLRSPYSLAMDFIQNELYWTDGQRGSIDAFNLRTQTRRTVIQSDEYYPVWVGVFEDWVYWSDRKRNALLRVNKWKGSDPELLFNMSNPHSFRLQHDLLRPVWVNRCTARFSTKRCEHLCLPVPLRYYPNYSVPFRCACADGWDTDERDPTRCKPIDNSSLVATAAPYNPVHPETFWAEKASFLRDWIGQNGYHQTSETSRATATVASYIPMAILIALLVACILALCASYLAFRNYRQHLHRKLDAHLAAVRSSEGKLLLASAPSSQSMETRKWAECSTPIRELQAHDEAMPVQFHVDSSAMLVNRPEEDDDMC